MLGTSYECRETQHPHAREREEEHACPTHDGLRRDDRGQQKAGQLIRTSRLPRQAIRGDRPRDSLPPPEGSGAFVDRRHQPIWQRVGSRTVLHAGVNFWFAVGVATAGCRVRVWPHPWLLADRGALDEPCPSSRFLGFQRSRFTRLGSQPSDRGSNPRSATNTYAVP